MSTLVLSNQLVPRDERSATVISAPFPELVKPLAKVKTVQNCSHREDFVEWSGQNRTVTIPLVSAKSPSLDPAVTPKSGQAPVACATKGSSAHG
jgi:hypothetical protein